MTTITILKLSDNYRKDNEKSYRKVGKAMGSNRAIAILENGQFDSAPKLFSLTISTQ